MPWQVFYSYSHKDETLRDQLATYLAPLTQKKSIVEWHDRKILPGTDWNAEINTQLDSADLVVVLLSPDFLASDYCFGIEMEKAFTRLKRGEVKLVPILLRPCLWEESRFSALQIIPRDTKPITSSTSVDEAFKAVSIEIRAIVSEAKPEPQKSTSDVAAEPLFESSLDLVRRQIHAYARLYEKTRQRLRPSNDRTSQMELVFQKMRALATASYPLLNELSNSPSPGDRLAAVSVLQVFSDEDSLEFLVDLVGTEKPFVGYHATKALRSAVGSLDSTSYPKILFAVQRAQALLQSASVGFDSDRQNELRAAEQELRIAMATTSPVSQSYD